MLVRCHLNHERLRNQAGFLRDRVAVLLQFLGASEYPNFRHTTTGRSSNRMYAKRTTMRKKKAFFQRLSVFLYDCRSRSLAHNPARKTRFPHTEDRADQLSDRLTHNVGNNDATARPAPDSTTKRHFKLGSVGLGGPKSRPGPCRTSSRRRTRRRSTHRSWDIRPTRSPPGFATCG